MPQDEAKQAQVALLEKLYKRKSLTAEEYREELAALGIELPQILVQSTQVEGDHNVVGNGNQVITELHVHQEVTQPGPSGESLRRAYLHSLMVRTQILPLSGVDLKTAEQGESELKLAAVYIALLTERLDQDERKALSEKMRGERQRLSAVEVLDREKYLVLLGDPGSGKSTFVGFVGLCLAGEALGDAGANLAALTAPLPHKRPEWQRSDKDNSKPQPWRHKGLLPVMVTLRDFVARGLPEPGQVMKRSALWDFIVKELGHPEYAPHLKKELLEKGGLILLDGLDEVPEADRRREQVKTAIGAVVEDFGRCRFLVTSRTYAYQRQEWKLPGFAEVVLAPFTSGQVERFVDQWYAHVGELRHWDKDHAQGQATLLKTAIERSERLQELSARPLLLTLMASLHAWRSGSLPEKREELYAETVDWLLEKWERRKVIRDATGKPTVQQPSLTEWLKVDRAVVRAELNRLAFEAHRDQEQLTGTADIAQGKLVGALLSVSKQQEPRPNPAELEAYLCNRAGLLIERGVEVYAFPHRTFQEYLAACYLTDHGYPDDVAELLRGEPQRWREATLLAGAKAAGGTTSAVWNLAEALCYQDPPPSAAKICNEADFWGALLAGQLLIENGVGKLSEVSARHRPKWERIQRWLTAIVEHGWLPVVDRAAAGNALAALGDARPGVGVVDGIPDIVWCEVPAGEFWMGGERYDDEKPVHRVTLRGYRISKYPVTVAQFRCFVERSGYQVEDPACLRGVDNHPVVDITWYEALDYCQWLMEVLQAAGRLGKGEIVTLPSEAEWEKAARGDKDQREYPWGNAWDAQKCNVDESGIGTTSTVGIFPEGASPYGVLDMTGNVWEWTRSLWGKDWSEPDFKYPYRPSDGREDLKAGEGVDRVLRGGAFDLNQGRARCSYRFRNALHNRDRNYGVRVVVPISRS